MTDVLLARIRKLLAKAEDPAATAAESETYTAKAAELIATYGVDRALLAEELPGSDVIGDRIVTLPAPYARDKAALLTQVAVPLRCRTVLRERRDPSGAREFSVHLFGFASDLERADLLFTSLLLQATTQLSRVSPPWRESVAAYRRSWLAGFGAAVAARLSAAEERAAEEAGRVRTADPDRTPGAASVALVLADRTDQVDAARDRTYPHLERGRRRELSGSGGRSGYAAGRRADLGSTRLGGARAPIGR
jgi:hypothetical protein